MDNESWIKINRNKGMVSDIWESGSEILFVCLLCVLVPDRGGKVCEFFFYP